MSTQAPVRETGRQPDVAVAPTGRRPRLRSLDVARGIVVLTAVFLSQFPGPPQFEHAAWYGLTVIDLIFPSFVTLSGVGLALAYRRRVAYRRVIRRTLVLVALGLAFNAVALGTSDPSLLRFTGVLQLIAVVGLLTTLVSRVLTRAWSVLALAGALLVGYAVLLHWYGGACAGGLPQPTCNPGGPLDRAVFGLHHVYAAGRLGYDPEGLLPVLAAVANGLIGYAAGLILIGRGRARVVAGLLGLAAGLAVAGLPLEHLVPVAKRLWSPPFAVFSAALAIGLLALCYVVIDAVQGRVGRAVARITWPIEATGRNSLLVYFGKMLIAVALVRFSVGRTKAGEWLLHRFDGWPGLPAPYWYTLAMVAGWILLASALHHHRWYFRA